jgi:hypothetical protein
MKLSELLVERRFPARKQNVMSYTKNFPTMPSSDPYQAYRFGMAMANHQIDYPEGPTRQGAVIVAYTREEEDIIKGGESQSGHKGVEVADRGSEEPDSTNKTSPVAKIKKNRFGV